MPTKKTATKGGKKAPAKSAKAATKAPAKAGAKKAPAKAAAKKTEGAKAKPAAKAAKGGNGTDTKAVKEKATTKSGATPRDVAPPVAVAAAPKRDGGAKKGKGESQRAKPVIPWAQRFKDDAPGPWTCPKCGALPQRAQPLYGEDERHHCPNLDCDQIVTLLSKEDLEPAEKRGSWPPQRNKNRAIPAAGGAPGAPPAGGGGGGGED